MMKKLYPLIFLFALAFGSLHSFAQFATFGSWDGQGVPSYLISPRDVISNFNKNTIATTLPEKVSVPTYNPQYLSNTPTDIKLTKTSDVYITFVTEGAVYLNVLGFYTYDVNNPPTTAPPASQIKVIFPNCSLPGSGGYLQEGDKVFLGRFPANTGIGWVCLGDAFQPGAAGTIGPGKWSLFSNPNFNPESDASLRRHNVLLNDTAEHKIILAFEDIRRDDPTCDHDFNDMIFYVDVNDGADLTGMPKTTGPGGPVNPGSGGGLESENLGDLVSKRDFARLKNSISPLIDYTKVPVFAKNQGKGINVKGTDSFELQDMIPLSFGTGYSLLNTSPKDILALTKAVDVLAVDYTKDNKADAVVLGIKTLNTTYNHTKQTCDRFKGGELLDMDTIRIQGNKFIRFAIRNQKGGVEYAISFTASKDAGFYNIQTNWLRADYTDGKTMYTFQVWASKPHYSVKLVNDILTNLSGNMPLKQINTDISLPKAFISMGNRIGENLQIYINNKSAETSAALVFDETLNEKAEYTNIKMPVALKPFGITVMNIPVKDGFTYEGGLNMAGKEIDGVYFADGNWGVDYDASYTNVKKFIVANDPGRKYSASEYAVYRNIDLTAVSTDYIALYKYIHSGNTETDLSNYNSIKFFAKGTGTVNLKLAKGSIMDWRSQYYTTIELTPEGKEYLIRFDTFHSNGIKGKFNPDDVSSIIYTVETAGAKPQDINISISKVAFVKQLSTLELQSKSLVVYPNPSSGKFNFAFSSEIDAVLQRVATDITGKTIFKQTVQAVKGSNVIPVELINSNPGIIILSLKGDGIKYKSKKILLGE